MITNMLLVGVCIALIFALFIGIALAYKLFYKRTTKDTAYIRTGVGGAKVIKDGGGWVIPAFHILTPVSLRSTRLLIHRAQKEALITKDNLLADVTAEVTVRVAPTEEGIAAAATSFGNNSNAGEGRWSDESKAIFEGKCVSALRSVAAMNTLSELHLDRARFSQDVQKHVSEELRKNGLELESVSITTLNQTAVEHFDPQNTLQAEGLTRQREITQENLRKQFDIEAINKVAIAERKREATLKTLEIERETATAELEQKQKIEAQKSATESQIEQKAAQAKQESEEARIKADQAVREAEIQRDSALTQKRQRTEIEIAKQSQQTSAAAAEASLAKAEAAKAEQAIVTANAVAEADRVKAVALVEASQKAEQDAVRVRIQATADKDAAELRAQAITVNAQAEADAKRIAAEADRVANEVKAEGIRAVNDARNSLSQNVIDQETRLKAIEIAPAILAEATKSMEKIDSIKIVQLAGVGGGVVPGTSNDNGGKGSSLPDSVVQAALNYRVGAPLVDSIMREVGMSGSEGLNGLLAPIVSEMAKPVANDKIEVPAAENAPAKVQVDFGKAEPGDLGKAQAASAGARRRNGPWTE